MTKIEKLSEMCLEGKIIHFRPAEIGCPRASTQCAHLEILLESR